MLLKEIQSKFLSSYLENEHVEIAAARNITKLYSYSENLRYQKSEKEAFNKYKDVFKCSKGEVSDLLIA